MTPTVLLVGRPLRRWRALPVQFQLLSAPSDGCRAFSVLSALSGSRGTELLGLRSTSRTRGGSDSSARVQALLLRRAMATGLPSNPDGDDDKLGKRQPHQQNRVRKTPSKDEEELEAASKLREIETAAAAARILKQKLAVDLETARNLALRQVVNVPNVITVARILSTPYLAYLIVQGDHVSAIGLLAVAGLSDWADGYIARTLKQESIVGSFLDPFADKLLIGTLSLSMMWTGLLPWPLVTLIFGRDVLLISGTFYHRLKTKDESAGFFDTSDSEAFEIKPSLLSKVNTALQLSLFGLTLTNAAWQLPTDPVLHFLFGVVGTTTFLSGSEYFWSYMNQTGAFRPLRKAVEVPLRKAAERTEAVKRPIRKAVERTKERLTK